MAVWELIRDGVAETGHNSYFRQCQWDLYRVLTLVSCVKVSIVDHILHYRHSLQIREPSMPF